MVCLTKLFRISDPQNLKTRPENIATLPLSATLPPHRHKINENGQSKVILNLMVR